MKIQHKVCRVSAIAVLALASLAQAHASPISIGQSVTYELNQFNTSTTTTSYGTVKLTQGDGSVSFTVTPAASVVFANTSGPHFEFAFNLADAFDNATVTLTGQNANDFKIMTGTSFTQAPFGNFDHAIDFASSIRPGTSAKYAQPLTFTVSQASLNIDDFVANTSGFLFAADLGLNGNTQNIAAILGATTPTRTEVPEPATLALFGSGLLAAALRRRKH